MDKPILLCGEHHIPKQWRPTAFEYTEDGITIRVQNIFAWVCPSDGKASFTPDTTDEIIGTVRDLIQIAKRARQRRSVLTEYVVAVG